MNGKDRLSKDRKKFLHRLWVEEMHTGVPPKRDWRDSLNPRERAYLMELDATVTIPRWEPAVRTWK